MMNVHFQEYNEAKPNQKNVLYKVTHNCIIPFVEQHKDSRDIVNVEFVLEDGQHGIYANEYKRPGIEKDGCKVADVLACIIDENKKEIDSLVFDVKKNISAFSDDLSKKDAMITAIKDVRDYIAQIRAELLHKESFLLYYKDEDYVERERVGIATRSFEPDKFVAVAERLEKLIAEEQSGIPPLILYKAKNNLNPYKGEIEPLYNFAKQKIVIRDKVYQMQVFLLCAISETDYATNIQMAG